MLLSVFLTCVVALVLTTTSLFVLGQRIRVASRLVGGLSALVLVAVSGEVAGRIWNLPSEDVVYGEALLLACTAVVIGARGVWNPIGQVFFGALAASGLAYLWFGIETTFGGGLSVEAQVASVILLIFEGLAIVLSGSFAFECCDTICRVKGSRRLPQPDPNYRPMVSIEIAAYNEPPDMLIETIQSVEALEYENFEIVVIDNNTTDESMWRPVAEYCESRERVHFVHVEHLEGFKSGALNLVLAEHTDPGAEILGIVDADYHVDPSWLTSLVGYFADPTVAFVQTPQDYREYEGDPYLQSCYDAYRYFFSTTMPSRNQRNSIIFAGTMGLLRRAAVEEAGGWDEWCITEDAELSLRILKAGYQGVYRPESYGKGIMPLTFASLKSQRFRWCFGGMQILRKHHHELAVWDRAEDNHLSTAQRLDYFVGNAQWLNDLVYLGFTIALLASALVLIGNGPLGLRPLYGAAVLLPAVLILSGLLRALWALHVRTGIGFARASLGFLNWLALSWVVAFACIQGLIRRRGTFLPTPKFADRRGLLAAMWSVKAEMLWVVLLWGAAVAAGVSGHATAFVVALLTWQGMVYASAALMAWLNQRTELSAQLERRRRTEYLRDRIAGTVVLGGLGASVAGVALAFLVALGGSNPGHPPNPFLIPQRGSGDAGPLAELIGNEKPPSTTTAPPVSAPPTSRTTPAATNPAPATTTPPPTTSASPPSSSPPTTAATPPASP